MSGMSDMSDMSDMKNFLATPGLRRTQTGDRFSWKNKGQKQVENQALKWRNFHSHGCSPWGYGIDFFSSPEWAQSNVKDLIYGSNNSK